MLSSYLINLLIVKIELEQSTPNAYENIRVSEEKEDTVSF